MRKDWVVVLAMVLMLLGLPSLSGPGLAEPFPYYLQGTVTDDLGGPVPGVSVMAVNVSNDLESYSILTDSSGAYNLSVPTGTYVLTASLENHTANVTYSSVIVPDQSGESFDFMVTEVLGIVVGFVTNGQVPINGVTVWLSNDRFNYSALSTPPLGRYDMTGVEPGIYVAYAEKHGYERANYPYPVEVMRGDVVEINFTLTEQPARLSGTVAGEDDELITNALISLTSIDFNTSGNSGLDGNYTITSIPAGTYDVTVTAEGYETQQLSVTFDPFENKRLDIIMVRQDVNETTYLFGYDLPHSLMLVGLGLGLTVVVLAIILYFRVQRSPRLLTKMETEEEPPKPGS